MRKMTRTRPPKVSATRRKDHPVHKVQKQKWARKNIVIDQYKLDLAKTFLKTPTETATIDQALDLVAFQAEVFAGIDRMIAAGGIEDSFEDR